MVNEFFLSKKYIIYSPILASVLFLIISPYVFIFFVLFGILPSFIKFKTTKVTLRDEKIEIISGLIVKEKKEIFYNKINSIEVIKNPLQSFLGTSSIILRTGNDIVNPLDNFENSDDLLEKISIKVNKN